MPLHFTSLLLGLMGDDVQASTRPQAMSHTAQVGQHTPTVQRGFESHEQSAVPLDTRRGTADFGGDETDMRDSGSDASTDDGRFIPLN